MERLGQQDLGITDRLSDGVVLFSPCKRELRERRLIPGRVFDVDEVLVVRDAVVFRQLEQTNESLEQRSPGDRGPTPLKPQLSNNQVLVFYMFTLISIDSNQQVINPMASCLPEFRVFRVHHRRTLRQDLCYTDCADFLLDCSRNLLDFWDHDFFQHHAEHPVKGRAEAGIKPGERSNFLANAGQFKLLKRGTMEC